MANSPCDGVDGDGPGLVQVLRDEHLAGRPVQPGHLYPVRAGVRPVEVAGDDVDGDPVGMVHFLRHHHLFPCPGVNSTIRGATTQHDYY